MAIAKVILNGTTLMDVTQDTVTASTLKQGETAHGADGEEVVGTMSGNGSGSSDGDVIFLDYDGTVVDAKTKTEINAMTSDSDLPANPTHTGLTAQGWNWTVAQLKTQLTAMPSQKVYVGQMYVTQSGKTEIDVTMPEGRLSPILTICVNGTVEIDWGDNITPDTITGTSETTRKAVSHTYASAGNYTISITVISGTYSFYGSNSYTLLRKNTVENENKVYNNCIKAVRIGTGITNIRESAFRNCFSLASITIPSSVTSIGDGVFCECYPLTSITIPNGVTSIGNSTLYRCVSLSSLTIPSSITSIGTSAFFSCSSLKSITIPSGITSIGGSAFSSCSSLASITFPSSMTSIGNYSFQSCTSLSSITILSSTMSIGTSAFNYCCSLLSITIPSDVTSIVSGAWQSCYSLKSITIPNGVTNIGNDAFGYCYSLGIIIIPSTVTSIGNTAFQQCYGVKEYHILPTTVPTAGTTIFKNLPSDCVIYVPQGKLTDYQTATNWSEYASYMQEELTT